MNVRFHFACVNAALFTLIVVSGASRECSGQIFTTTVDIEDSAPELLLGVGNGSGSLYGGLMTITPGSGEWVFESFSAFGAERTGPFVIGYLAPNNSIFIASNGDIGLGTALPEATLHVTNPAGLGTLRLDGYSGGTSEKWGLISDPGTYVPGGGLAIQSVSSGTIPVEIQNGAPNASLSITKAGYIGLGTTSPQATLHVTNPDGPGTIRIDGKSGGTGEEWGLISDLGAYVPGGGLAIQSVSGGTVPVEIQNGAPNASLSITKAGYVGLSVASPTKQLQLAGGAYCTGKVWHNACSRDYKQDIMPITSEMARKTVQKLQPVGYRYKNEPDETYVGFIAEDVPDLVATNDRKSLASMDIVAVLTKVVQDQEEAIIEARQRHDRIEARNEHLEAIIKRQEDLLAAMNKRLAAIELNNP